MPTKAVSEYMAFRPGDLASKIEGMARRTGCSKSDVIRRAVEVFVTGEPLLPYALYLGAAWEFSMVAKAARELGLFEHSSLFHLVKALEVTEQQVREKLEPLVGPKKAAAWYSDGPESRFPDLEEACRTLKRLAPEVESPTGGPPIPGEAEPPGDRRVKPFSPRRRK
jgi:hypothetical protein